MMLTALIILVLVLFSFLLFFLDSIFGGLDFGSSSTAASLVVKIIKDRHLEQGIFYDLGSARGSFVCKIAQALPTMQVTGFDDSSFRVLVSKLRALFLKNINFKKADIFKTNLSPANVTFIYLPQELMSGLQEKLQKELKPGAIVISNKVNFPSWQPTQKLNNLFVYVKN